MNNTIQEECAYKSIDQLNEEIERLCYWKGFFNALTILSGAYTSYHFYLVVMDVYI